ncbi:unnamed protein product [Cyclocybe aegerita]|uniref:Uncharacterized protein n=1 Tax=Cyclocybe aegerita TaxID=1973307 RepID=A0A8S0WZS7_CYCAE|nr:unnamed protein product [Cyclocybe aegerita]
MPSPARRIFSRSWTHKRVMRWTIYSRESTRTEHETVTAVYLLSHIPPDSISLQLTSKQATTVGEPELIKRFWHLACEDTSSMLHDRQQPDIPVVPLSVPFATAIKTSGENFVGTDVAAEQTKYDNLVAEKDELVDAVLEEAENFLGLNFGSIIGTIGKVTGTIAGAAGKAISIAEKIGPIVQRVTQAKDVLQGISGALASSSNFTEDKAQTEQIAATAQKADDLDAALAQVQGSLKVLEDHKKALIIPESFTEDEPEAENFLPIVFGAIQAVSTVVGIVKTLRK